MNILDEIVAYKKQEVAERKQQTPLSELEHTAYFLRPALSLKRFLLDPELTGIIAEFKRQSPSKGVINNKADVVEVTTAYAANGASGISVLTDTHFFGGTTADLQAARINEVPILRKDFIIDEYQVTESKAIGADVILLIAAILTPGEVKRFTAKAHELGLEVILEIHSQEELDHYYDAIDIIGVNNRDLKSFKVDLEQSIVLGHHIPAGKIKISESGIYTKADIQYLKQYGYQGFLIGENFMRADEPAVAFMRFVADLTEPLP